MRISKLALGALLLCSMAYHSGCAAVKTPASGAWYSDVKDGALISGNVGASKSASGVVKSYLGLFAFGDASINTIMTSAGITKIHHVDYQAQTMFGIIATYTVTVYGE